MAKRDLTSKINDNSTASDDDGGEKKEPAALSDNISLFQSLRVLQEGEEGDDRSGVGSITSNNNTISYWF